MSLCRQKGCYVPFICTRRASQGVNGGFSGLASVVGCMMRQIMGIEMVGIVLVETCEMEKSAGLLISTICSWG